VLPLSTDQDRVITLATACPHGAVVVADSDLVWVAAWDAAWGVVWDAAWHIRMLTAQVCPMLRIHTLPHRIGHPPMVGKKQDQLDSWAVPRSNQQANPRKLLSLYQISLSEIDRPRLLVRE